MKKIEKFADKLIEQEEIFGSFGHSNPRICEIMIKINELIENQEEHEKRFQEKGGKQG